MLIVAVVPYDSGGDGSRAEDFARLVGGRGDDRQAAWNAGGGAGGGVDRSQPFAHRNQFRQLFRTNGQRLPFPVAPAGPAMAPEIDRQIGDQRTGGVGKAAGQALVQQAGEQQVLVRLPVNLRFMPGQPVDLGVALEGVDGALLADQREGQRPPRPDCRHGAGASLVEPGDHRMEAVAFVVHRHDRGALRRCRDTAQLLAPCVLLPPQLPAAARRGLPERLAVVLVPARVRRLIVVEGFLRPPDQIARQVEEQGADALRSAIDGQQQVVVTLLHDKGLSGRLWQRPITVAEQAHSRCRRASSRTASSHGIKRRATTGSGDWLLS